MTDPTTQPIPPSTPSTSRWSITPAEVRKFLAALVGAAGVAVTQGLLSGSASEWAAIGISIATAALVYVVPNSTPAATASAEPTEPADDVQETPSPAVSPTEAQALQPKPLGPHGGGPPETA